MDMMKAPPKPAEASSRTVELGSRRLSYLDYGTKGRRPILFLHGGGAHAHWFDFVAGAFTADHHVLALDQRGHGDSDWADPPDYSYESFAADVARFSEACDLRDFVLVGHSMGGLVALVYAATYPGRIGKLVIVDSMMQMSPEVFSSMRSVGERGRSYDSRVDFITRFRLRPGNTQAAPEVIRRMAEFAGKADGEGQWRHKFDRSSYATRELMDALPCWERIGVPALLVKGGLSARITPEVLASVRARCPQVAFAEVAGSDHHVMLDRPNEFARVLRSFIEQGA